MRKKYVSDSERLKARRARQRITKKTKWWKYWCV